jgi:uncharacterized membrane protein YkvA (DUF1232 family)
MLRRAGRSVAEPTLLLVHTLRAPGTPAWVRTEIVGVLAYLALPLDMIPDFLPLGFSDDLIVISAAVASLGTSITDEIRSRVRRDLDRCFG